MDRNVMVSKNEEDLLSGYLFVTNSTRKRSERDGEKRHFLYLTEQK